VSPSGDRGSVGTGTGLAETEGTQHLATGERPQVAFFLGRRPMTQDTQADQRVVHLKGGRGRTVNCGDLHDGERIGDVVGPGTAPFGWHRHAEQAEVGHPVESLTRKARRPVSFCHRRRQLGLGEASDEVANLSLAVGQHELTLVARPRPVLVKIAAWRAWIRGTPPDTGGTGI